MRWYSTRVSRPQSRSGHSLHFLTSLHSAIHLMIHLGSSRKGTSPAMPGNEVLDHILAPFLALNTWNQKSLQPPWLAAGSFACLDAMRLMDLTRRPVCLSLTCLLPLLLVRSVKTRPARRYRHQMRRQLQGQSLQLSTRLCSGHQSCRLLQTRPHTYSMLHSLLCFLPP